LCIISLVFSRFTSIPYRFHMRLYAIAALIALIAGLPSSASAGQAFVGMAAFYPGRGGGLTAAHKSLPFGTRVRVTDPKTGRSVVVTINDRGHLIGAAYSIFAQEPLARWA
jgi:hypothetical protein